MAVLSSRARNALKSTQFGMPGSRKYPMPDANHQVNAKARATQQMKKGNISKSTRDKIVAKANSLLGK